MKRLLLCIAGLLALLVVLINLGPMVLLGVSIWFLYLISKQFLKSDSTVGRIVWIILGLFVLSIAFSNIFAVIGVVAVYGLYLVIKHWRNSHSAVHHQKVKDPFQNFEHEWAELHH